MKYEKYMEVDRLNKILLNKMGRIMNGKYQSSTLDQQRSPDCKFVSVNES